MLVRPSILLALVGVLIARSGPAWSQNPPAAPDSNAVALLPLDVVGNVPAGRPALESAAARGLAMFAGTTVEAAQASARLTAAGARVPCQDVACWTAAGKAVGTRHLVAGRVERKGANFEVQFRLFEGTTGRLLATESNQCEAADCSVAELTRQTARELARQMLNGTVPGVSKPGTVAMTPTPGGSTDSAAAPVVPLESPPAALVQSATVQDTGPSTARRLLPYASIAAGVGTLGVGGWLIWRDGNCAEQKLAIARACNTYRETMWEGVAVTGVGAALLATGVVVAITDHQDARNRTVVLIGPRSLLLAGRF